MVFIKRVAYSTDVIKQMYDASRWEKLKTMYRIYYETNPTFAVVVPIAVTMILSGYAFNLYIKKHRGEPKFHDYLCIYRPDDPRVKKIRTDDVLLVRRLPNWWERDMPM
ncbi:hypothetical protein WH47_01963 [Habropoda laboriosa]|uniref:Uncharacterized protein n=1 Tax=Habropoda laboriosa TaxID=597456 RepID=A0A0L7QXX9_9HYME|nr:PREDICTED: uncharacterized protein LOC108574082 [Habropoda laboriosa]KOC63473.1 hypothetical protein WH47_01963 [Habropoda laboriosa]